MHPNLALRRLAARLQPIATEVAAARQHFGTIRARLTKSFLVSRVVQIGSHVRGTAIRTHSDVDILAVLRRREARWGNREVSPDTFISRVSHDLKDRYTATAIRRDGQAVVVQFQGGAHAVDVVPAIFARFEAGCPVFRIPGKGAEWIETSPERHNRAFTAANARSGGKLRVLSQLVKGWRFARTPPFALSSFYTDMLLASRGIASGVKSYSECLFDFFDELVRREARGLRDPEGISGLIFATSSDAARDRLMDGADAARAHAVAAFAAEAKDDHKEAIRQWSIVFNRSV